MIAATTDVVAMDGTDSVAATLAEASKDGVSVVVPLLTDSAVAIREAASEVAMKEDSAAVTPAVAFEEATLEADPKASPAGVPVVDSPVEVTVTSRAADREEAVAATVADTGKRNKS